MDSGQAGMRSQHRHYPYWYEGYFSTWLKSAKYPRKTR